MVDDSLIKFKALVPEGYSVLGKLPPAVVALSFGGAEQESSGTTNANLPVGPTDSSKVVCITLGWRGEGTLSSVTLNGSPMTVLQAISTLATPSVGAGIAYLAHTSSNNASLVVSFSSVNSFNYQAFYAVSAPSVTDFLGTFGTVITISANLDLVKQGASLGVFAGETSSNPASWLALTEVSDTDVLAGTPFRYSSASLSGITANSSAVVAVTTASTDVKAMVAISLSS